MRTRILDAALALLVEGGREAVSARAVTTAAGIQAPTLYRIFGDMHGLLDAVALHGFEAHLATWQGPDADADPIEAIRLGWDMHVQWGVENPGLYSIAYGGARVGAPSVASSAIDAILTTVITEAARAGRLAVPVDQAVHMLRAVGTGVVFTLIAMPEAVRDGELSVRAREAALSSFLTADPTTSQPHRSGAAMQLKAELGHSSDLSTNEKALLGDWLDRLARHPD